MDTVAYVDLVLFEVAGIRYAADLGQVRRIDIDEPTESIGHPLGPPARGNRALVFSVADHAERRLAIDQVLGVSRVPLTDLRRMPVAVHAAPFNIGAWLDGEQTVLLVDLPSMLPNSAAQAAV
ncbi:MAG: Frizzy aggregation protein FrzB [Archangium gephyra]|uniref:Frizzy aggregation protein FrzB n=1 Tax=Archangium gephyra TaxID=48 RepID=A0A2W5W2F1_9BACT|nr:MAG: Frizzy aggregation protein FrzB [Archangium gephyra]